MTLLGEHLNISFSLLKGMTDDEFKNKILKEIDGLTVKTFDKFYDIIKQFFGRAYGIKYQFTLDELHAEIKKREKNEKIRGFMDKFLEEVQAVEFGGEEISDAQLHGVKSIFKRVVELVEVEIGEGATERKKETSKWRRRIDAGVTMLLFLGLITVLVLYFVKVNIVGTETEIKVIEPGEVVNGEPNNSEEAAFEEEASAEPGPS